MTLAECLAAAWEALALLAARPLFWLGVVLAFLVAVESLMFIPYIGFLAKLAVAGIVSAGVLVMFAKSAAGARPGVVDWLSAFALPFGAQAVLAFVAVAPFAVGVAYLYVKAGAPAIQFFFGHILRDKPPAPGLFVEFKYVMELVALPFALVTGAVVLRGLSGVAAISAALTAAIANWLPVLILGLLGFAFEWLSAQLPLLMPKALAVGLGVLLLVLYLGWTFAIVYSLSVRIFPAPIPRTTR